MSGTPAAGLPATSARPFILRPLNDPHACGETRAYMRALNVWRSQRNNRVKLEACGKPAATADEVNATLDARDASSTGAHESQSQLNITSSADRVQATIRGSSNLPPFMHWWRTEVMTFVNQIAEIAPLPDTCFRAQTRDLLGVCSLLHFQRNLQGPRTGVRVPWSTQQEQRYHPQLEQLV